MSKLKAPQILLIKWNDSHATHGWHHEEECDAAPAKCESVGYLVSETKDSITLAQSRARATGQTPWAEFITIPKSAITKRKKLRGKANA